MRQRFRVVFFFALVLVVAACSSGSQTPMVPPGGGGGSMAVSSMSQTVDRFSKANHFRLLPSDGSRLKVDAVTQPGQGYADTMDYCFNGGPDPTFYCATQGGTITLTWTLSPQPPNGTVITWSDSGLPSGVAAQDVFSPAVQNNGPYTTTQTINVAIGAPVTSAYQVGATATCSSGVGLPPCGSNQTYLGQAGVSVLCSVSLGHCPNLAIHDNNLREDVAAPNPIGTPLTVVGAPQDLTATFASGSGSGTYSVSLPEWTVPGSLSNPPTEIKSALLSNSSASFVALSQGDLTGPEIGFYYLNGSGVVYNNPPPLPSQVNAPQLLNTTTSITVGSVLTRSDNQEVAVGSATATYTVDAPSLQLSAAPTQQSTYGTYGYNLPSVGSVKVGTGLAPTPIMALSVGTNVAQPATSGFVDTVTGTMPRSYAGAIGVSQTLEANAHVDDIYGYDDSNVASFDTGQTFMADECALMTPVLSASASTATPATMNFAAAQPILLTTASSPAFIVDPATESAAGAAEHLHDYVLFKPTVPNAIWVSEGYYDWNWSGSVAFNNGSSSFTGTNPANPLYSVLGADDEPVWTGARRYVNAVCPVVP